MKSCIYKGSIRHRRFAPVKNRFRYGIFMVYLDLEELAGLFDGCALWSYEKPNLASWRRRNYLGPRDLTLREAVKFRIEDQGLTDPGGPVRMLTQASYFGYCYNPVSFYYCFDRSGEKLEIIIAEINNTPWKERQAYVLPAGESISDTADRFRFRLEKTFHVSPFMPMNVQYDWRFKAPGSKLNIHMIDRIGDEKHFDATLTLERREMTPARLNLMLLKYPFMTARTLSLIYYQALKLWAKRTPFYENPEPRTKEYRDPYETVEKAIAEKKR
jgi:uncharacterized protein